MVARCIRGQQLCGYTPLLQIIPQLVIFLIQADNLTVPALAGAQALDLSGLAAARRDVVERARTGKLTRADLTGGTFTVSNLGMMGIDRFDAILNPPQVAILAVGSTTQRQVWNDGDPAWRPIAELTLTCDHRAVDGAAGAGFLATLREHLQA